MWFRIPESVSNTSTATNNNDASLAVEPRGLSSGLAALHSSGIDSP